MDAAVAWFALGVSLLGLLFGALLPLLPRLAKTPPPGAEPPIPRALFLAVGIIALVLFLATLPARPPWSAGQAMGLGLLLGAGAALLAAGVLSRATARAAAAGDDSGAATVAAMAAAVGAASAGLLAVALAVILLPRSLLDALGGLSLGAVVAAGLMRLSLGLRGDRRPGGAALEGWAIYTVTLAAAVAFAFLHFPATAAAARQSPLGVAAVALVAVVAGTGLFAGSPHPARAFGAAGGLALLLVGALSALALPRLVGGLDAVGVTWLGLGTVLLAAILLFTTEQMDLTTEAPEEPERERETGNDQQAMINGERTTPRAPDRPLTIDHRSLPIVHSPSVPSGSSAVRDPFSGTPISPEAGALLALMVAALFVVAFQWLRGYGVGLALVAAWAGGIPAMAAVQRREWGLAAGGDRDGAGAARVLLRFLAVALLPLLFRLFLERNRPLATDLSLTLHFTLLGLVIGAIAPLFLASPIARAEWRARPGSGIAPALILGLGLGFAVVAVPAAVGVAWGMRALVGLLAGLLVAGVYALFLSAADRRAAGGLALSGALLGIVAMALVTIQGAHLVGAFGDLPRTVRAAALGGVGLLGILWMAWSAWRAR